MDEVQCFDGDGALPPPELTVRIHCESVTAKDDFAADAEGRVELRLGFKNKPQADHHIKELVKVGNTRCWFVIASPELSIQFIGCYFLGHRQPNAWTVVAVFSEPEDIAQLKTRTY